MTMLKNARGLGVTSSGEVIVSVGGASSGHQVYRIDAQNGHVTVLAGRTSSYDVIRPKRYGISIYFVTLMTFIDLDQQMNTVFDITRSAMLEIQLTLTNHGHRPQISTCKDQSRFLVPPTTRFWFWTSRRFSWFKTRNPVPRTTRRAGVIDWSIPMISYSTRSVGEVSTWRLDGCGLTNGCLILRIRLVR